MKRILTALTLTTLLTTTAYAQNYGTLKPLYPGNDAGSSVNPYILNTPSGRYKVESKYPDLHPGDGRCDAGSDCNPFVTRGGEEVDVRSKYPGNDAGSYTNPYRLRRPLDEDE